MTPTTRRLTALSALLYLVGLPAPQATAHVGPPFPLLVDVPAGYELVSVWADPDIGEATFYIALESPDGRPAAEPASVSMWVQPVSGRLPKATYAAERQKLRNVVQFLAQPEFDQRDLWNIGFLIDRGGAAPIEVLAEVESTPPGSGPWDLLIYFFPFALLGGLWVLAMTRMKRRRPQLSTAPPLRGKPNRCGQVVVGLPDPVWE